MYFSQNDVYMNDEEIEQCAQDIRNFCLVARDNFEEMFHLMMKFHELEAHTIEWLKLHRSFRTAPDLVTIYVKLQDDRRRTRVLSEHITVTTQP